MLRRARPGAHHRLSSLSVPGGLVSLRCLVFSLPSDRETRNLNVLTVPGRFSGKKSRAGEEARLLKRSGEFARRAGSFAQSGRAAPGSHRDDDHPDLTPVRSFHLPELCKENNNNDYNKV